ncbi:MAG: fatty acid desaturase family protein [Sphingomonadales bacterium]|nr:fatty acid desaturase family protein [Sphingomonadales bacterium]
MIKVTDILSRGEIWQLRQKSTAQGVGLALHAWAVIIATMVAYAIWPSIWLLILGIFIVGARQLGFAVLMHDASHGLISPNRKVNEWAGEILCAWPNMYSMGDYRANHMGHHHYTQQEKDPDLFLIKAYPITKASMARKFTRDMLGITFVRLRFYQIKNAWGGNELSLPQHIKSLTRNMGGGIGLNILLWAIFASFGYGHVYFLLWLLPLATSFQLVSRIRHIADHAAAPSKDDDYTNTRTTYANMLERIFIAPYWVNYHIEHHFFMFAPCYRLKQAHGMLQEKGLVDKMEIQNSYLDVLKVASSGKT